MNLGNLVSDRGDFALAEKMHFDALAIDQKVRGKNDSKTQAAVRGLEGLKNKSNN